MRRVSSRQRLSSLDLFDANASDSSDDEYETCCDHFSTSSTLMDHSDHSGSVNSAKVGGVVILPPLPRRKRGRKTKMIVAEVTRRSSHFEHDLFDDIKLYICSFLTVKDGCALMATSRHHLDLIHNDTCLWKEWAHQCWPNMPRDASFLDMTSLRSLSNSKTNLHHLMSIQASGSPKNLVRKRSTFRWVKSSDERKTLQFVGAVGSGDRCVRANAALPRPLLPPRNFARRPMKSLFRTILRRGRQQRQEPPRPFVSPFVTNDVDDDKVVDVSPRLVSYFEITILEDTPAFPNQPVVTPMDPQVADCVAIGVSTQEFSCQSRMPGWDSRSYGYHGDDGGIFHASGEMKRRFGPAFGKGDTVGCGVDHRNAGIFFCLNGKFLGYAWTGLESFVARQELYPTIGVDTNHPIDANFGTRKFAFDLSSFISNQPPTQTQEQ
uniref:B30.2/SPRY domain-containing protein n=1 Tax=Cyclophora tenuis TaxID=216820 RepID=A0A7S1GNI7_CYCTE|mmetsp:Transcript_25691/g.43647  ORF Transcript_25691/g.43647 Transcript_25691/m.43647 type:complete len:436 (+) Transcript_25691:38-1345(+)